MLIGSEQVRMDGWMEVLDCIALHIYQTIHQRSFPRVSFTRPTTTTIFLNSWMESKVWFAHSCSHPPLTLFNFPRKLNRIARLLWVGWYIFNLDQNCKCLSVNDGFRLWQDSSKCRRATVVNRKVANEMFRLLLCIHFHYGPIVHGNFIRWNWPRNLIHISRPN